MYVVVSADADDANSDLSIATLLTDLDDDDDVVVSIYNSNIASVISCCPYLNPSCDNSV